MGETLNNLPPSDRQWNRLMDFLSTDDEMRSKEFEGPGGKARLEQKWRKAAADVNARGNAQKSGEKWKEAWEGLKSRSMKAFLQKVNYEVGTGGGPPSSFKNLGLSDVQERCLSLMPKTTIFGKNVPDPLQIQSVHEVGQGQEGSQQLSASTFMLRGQGNNSTTAASQPYVQAPQRTHSVPLQLPGVVYGQGSTAPAQRVTPTFHGAQALTQFQQVTPAYHGAQALTQSQQVTPAYHGAPALTQAQQVFPTFQGAQAATQVQQGTHAFLGVPASVQAQQVTPAYLGAGAPTQFQQVNHAQQATQAFFGSQAPAHEHVNLHHTGKVLRTPPFSPSPNARKRLPFNNSNVDNVASAVGDLTLSKAHIEDPDSLIESLQLLTASVSSSTDMLGKVVEQQKINNVELISGIQTLQVSIDKLTGAFESCNFSKLTECVNTFHSAVTTLSKL